MKMLLFTLAFAISQTVVVTQAFAADAPAHERVSGHAAGMHAEEHGKEHGQQPGHAEGHSAHKSIGEPQPVANPALATRPGRVTLVEPKALAKVKVGAVTLKWTPVAGVDTYTVQVATDPRFKWFVANEQFVKGDSFTTPNLEAGQYFWRVATKKAGNDAGYTTGFFTPSSFEAL